MLSLFFSNESAPKKSSPNEFLCRPLRFFIILGSVFMFAFFVWSAAEARKKTSNRIVDWLPRETRELEIFLNRYHKHFAEGEYMMVSWKGCDIADERLDAVAERLFAPQAVASVTGENGDAVPFFARVMTSRSVLADLRANIPQLSETGAKNRLSGWLIGHTPGGQSINDSLSDRENPDELIFGEDSPAEDSLVESRAEQIPEAACLVLVPNPQRWRSSPADAVAFLLNTVEEVTGLSRDDIYVAGTSIDGVAISEIAQQSQRVLLPIFLLFSLVLLFFCLRHYFAALLVFWVAMINEELAGALLHWFGAHVDSVSMLNASLVYVLTISGSVHLMNYYRKTLAEMKPGDDIAGIPLQTFRKAILPCSLAAFTTIIGIGSLAISKMVPIKTFGIYASLALFLGTIWFFLCILSVLQEKPVKAWLPKEGAVSASQRQSFWERLGLVIFRWQKPITVLTLLALIVFTFGIKDLKTSVTFHGLLPHDAKILQDYRTLEEKIGGLIPIEVVVQFPESDWSDRRMLDQIYFVDALSDKLWLMDNVDAVVSILNFLPNLPSQTDGGRAVARRAALEGYLDRNHERLRTLRFFNRVEQDDALENDVDAGNYWRLSMRIPAQKRLNYADMIQKVHTILEDVRQDNAAMNVDTVRFDVTGGVPLVQQAQHILLWDLIHSFIMAFGLIAVTMIIILRGIVRGLLAMIPNVFPCIIVFGMLGHCGIPIDMGSMMTASVALGISVDGTLHLLTWVSLAMRRGMTRKDAVLYALGRCSTALTQTMIICGVGMLIFALSDFVPVARFAILLCTILLISLAGSLIVLPAILFSPLGRFFENGPNDKEKTWIL